MLELPNKVLRPLSIRFQMVTSLSAVRARVAAVFPNRIQEVLSSFKTLGRQGDVLA
jgi:hypothetical protein